MDVFGALSSPTRRRLLELLNERDRPAGELARAFPDLPQPAISRHLRVLREAGLVRVSPVAQRRIYSLKAERLRSVDEWVARYRALWGGRLDGLEQHLDRRPSQRRAAGRVGGSR